MRKKRQGSAVLSRKEGKPRSSSRSPQSTARSPGFQPEDKGSNRRQGCKQMKRKQRECNQGDKIKRSKGLKKKKKSNGFSVSDIIPSTKIVSRKKFYYIPNPPWSWFHFSQGQQAQGLS